MTAQLSGVSPEVEAHAPAEDQRKPRGSWAARFLNDALSVAFLGALLWWLADRYGGWERDAFTIAAVLGFLTLPAALAEAARLPRFARAALGVWGIGAIVSLLVAVDRSGFVYDALLVGVMPLAGLAALRVWRRAWGPAALLLILLAGFGEYWHRSFLQWWGSTLLESNPRWLSLPWRNQSGILMGAFALILLGFAIKARPRLAPLWVLFCGAALAGAWLSGSRGGLVALGAGAAVGLMVGVREAGLGQTARRTAAAVGIAVLLTAGLASMDTRPGGSAVAGVAAREDPAGLHFGLRLAHMEAAARMLAERPVAGHGLGSYGRVALDYTRPDANLTASAHNEFLEALGEGGVVFGLPLLGLLGAGLVLVARAVRGVSEAPDESEDNGPQWLVNGLERGELTSAFRIGAAAAFAAMSVHAAADFDWEYPVLPALWMVTVALLYATTSDLNRGSPRRAAGLLVLAPAMLVLIAGLAGAYVEQRNGGLQEGLSASQLAVASVPWDDVAARHVATTLMSGGDVAEAQVAVQRGLAWNPGNEELVTLKAAIGFQAGTVSEGELIATVSPTTVRFHTYNTAAAALISEGRNDSAAALLEQALSRYPQYEMWGMTSVAEDSQNLLALARSAGSGP